MRLWNWLKTVPALVIIGSMLFCVLAIGGGLLLWGSNFANNMVHSQLSEQKISFPPKGPALDPEEFPGLQKYAGQRVDNGHVTNDAQRQEGRILRGRPTANATAIAIVSVCL